MLWKRGLALIVLGAVAGLVSCTTTGPFVLSFTGLPGTMLPAQTAVLTVVGGPGSSAGLWDWIFTVSPPGCGTVSPASYPPGNQTTVTTTFTAGSTPGACTVTVTLKTASGRTASRSQTTNIGAPLTLLPACTYPELADPGVPSGGVDNYAIAGTAGDRAFAYVQVYDNATEPPFNDDTVLHLRSAALGSPSDCPAAGDAECDNDDGADYSSLLGTNIAWDANSIIAGHPLPAASSFVAVNGFGGAAVDPYRLYLHVVPAANLVIPSSDPGNTTGTALTIPTSPTPWMIGEAITPAGDEDWYKFDANAGEAIFVALDMTPDTPGGSHDDNPSWDAMLELRDGTGTLLKTIDGSFIGFAGDPASEGFAIRINTTGTYFIGVRHFSATDTGPGYHLTACRMTTTVLPQGAEGPLGPPKEFIPKYPDDK